MRTSFVLPVLLSGVAMAQSAGTFAPTGRMTTPRTGSTATLLLDGKVLLAGGFLNTAELYDPATGTFAPTGSMRKTRPTQSATRLPDGSVLITGGIEAEIYDPSTGIFTLTGRMTTDRYLHTATLLNNGKVLITGGSLLTPSNGFSPDLASAEIYDPLTGVFSAIGNMPTVRSENMAILLANGKVLIVPGGELPGKRRTLRSRGKDVSCA
jgi:hypothetical protein